MMKYSQSAHSLCAIFVLFLLSLLLTACGGGSGSTGTNSPTVASDCQSNPGTTSMCSGTPTSGNSSSANGQGIDTNNAASITNAVFSAISTGFDLGGDNNTLSGLITAVQTQDIVQEFNLIDFALQQLSLARDRQNQSLLNSPQVIALQTDGTLNLACPTGGTNTIQNKPTPDSITVTFVNCTNNGVTYDGILDITHITGIPSTILPGWDRSALFSFSGLTVISSKVNIVLSGVMLFHSVSTNGLTGTSTITISATNNNSSNTQNSLATELRITAGDNSGITNTLSGFTLTDKFNLSSSPPEQHALSIRGNLDINTPGSIFNLSLDTPFDLVASNSQASGPFSSGTVTIVAGDGSQLTVRVDSSTSVNLSLTGPISASIQMLWTDILSATL